LGKYNELLLLNLEEYDEKLKGSCDTAETKKQDILKIIYDILEKDVKPIA